MKNINVCAICKKEFERPPSQLRAGTCSKACGYKKRLIGPNTGQFKKGHLPAFHGRPIPKWVREKMSLSRLKSKKVRDEQHYRWRGGSPGYWMNKARNAMRSAGIEKHCEDCGTSEGRIHVHHKDRDRKNFNLTNLQYLCISCHLKKHHGEQTISRFGTTGLRRRLNGDFR